MSDIAIRVQNLSKLYRIGQRERYYTLRDTLVNAWRAPFRYLRANGGQRPSGSDLQFAVRNSQSENYIWALKDVSFEVKRGEVIGIIGRNGAGKTTLLKILSRITKPTEGYAEVHGRVGTLLEVGTGFHPELTGRENIYLNGAVLGMKKRQIERKFDEIVSFAETEKFLDTPVKHYSSGMYMRLAFAVAAHLEPEILLVDEVLAVGDIAFQKKCLGKIEDVAKGGRTVLFVSHNMAAVRALCRSAIFVREGRKVCDGLVDSAIDHYLQASMGEGCSGKLHTALHRNNTGELWIDQVVLKNKSGEPVAQLRLAESFTVTIQFEIRQSARQVRIGVGFNTREGIRIATLHHTNKGLEPFSGNCGIYEISLNLINPLLPGTYIISVGAHKALGGLTLDYVPEALRFRVLDISADDDRYEAYDPGLVRFDASWLPAQRIE